MTFVLLLIKRHTFLGHPVDRTNEKTTNQNGQKLKNGTMSGQKIEKCYLERTKRREMGPNNYRIPFTLPMQPILPKKLMIILNLQL